MNQWQNQSHRARMARASHRLFVFPAIVVCALLLASCIAAPFQGGMNNLFGEEMDFEDFDRVVISDAFRVDIRQGDAYQIRFEVDDVTRDYLEVTQRDDTLEIGLRPRGISLFWIFRIFSSRQYAEIVMPTLVGIEANDASTVDVSGFRSDAETRIEVNDASRLTGDMDTGNIRLIARDASKIELDGSRGDVEIEASDASSVRLAGEGRNITIRAADASRVDLNDFPVQDATITAQDASHVTVDVSGELNAEAEDASRITYYGDPTVGNTTSSDGSRIEARNR
jgi:hypothetical protein